MEFLDMTGEPCPIPVAKAKEALANPEVDGVDVLVDNIMAVRNLEKMADGEGHDFSYRPAGENTYRVSVKKTAAGPAQPAPPAEAAPAPAPVSGAPATAPMAAPADPAAAGGATVLFSREGIGSGSDELAKTLAKGFIFALGELPAPPKCLIFLNGGAFFTSEGAGTLEDLKALEAKGCEIVTCGTCVEYYNLRDKLAVGAIVDMMGIAERLSGAGRLITL